MRKMVFRTPLWLSRLYLLCREVYSHFFVVDAMSKAGTLAYNTLFSVVPLMVLSFGFLIAFPAFKSFLGDFHKFLFRHLVPSSASTVQQHVEIFANNATKLSATGILFFLLTAVLLIFSMETVFNSVWKVKTGRRGMSAFLMYWAALTLLPPIGAIIFAGGAFLNSLPYLSSLITISALIIPLIFSWLGFLFLYLTLPNCKVLFRHASIGALIAAILLELMKYIFRLYVTYLSIDAVYGVISAIPVFLVWLYFLWLVAILGAVISYVLSVPKLKANPSK